MTVKHSTIYISQFTFCNSSAMGLQVTYSMCTRSFLLLMIQTRKKLYLVEGIALIPDAIFEKFWVKKFMFGRERGRDGESWGRGRKKRRRRIKNGEQNPAFVIVPLIAAAMCRHCQGPLNQCQRPLFPIYSVAPT